MNHLPVIHSKDFTALQVLFLDADSQPLVDPENIFSQSAFQDHGSLFWPDYQAAGEEDVGFSTCQALIFRLHVDLHVLVRKFVLTPILDVDPTSHRL